MKFTRVFRGVPDGEIYPVEYQPGDVCPPELAHAATEAGVLVADEQGGAALTAEDPEPAVDAESLAAPAVTPQTAAPAPAKAGKVKTQK